MTEKRSVLITGANGFIGASLARELVRRVAAGPGGIDQLRRMAAIEAERWLGEKGF